MNEDKVDKRHRRRIKQIKAIEPDEIIRAINVLLRCSAAAQPGKAAL